MEGGNSVEYESKYLGVRRTRRSRCGTCTEPEGTVISEAEPSLHFIHPDNCSERKAVRLLSSSLRVAYSVISYHIVRVDSPSKARERITICLTEV
uniref:Uncharacterized protein n=1 Tax=Utricularia reniformis TaxID=192314 RepID=A0A1Y0B2N2_9LAMI|nr:hypothetical protein AEK19_MT1512 [Utricularia reniformis]ART31702.1 hypothetical protein AEK19_MT1512 [Utricularia reniformis]